MITAPQKTGYLSEHYADEAYRTPTVLLELFLSVQEQIQQRMSHLLVDASHSWNVLR